jgi:hypothetical protein
MPTPGMGEAGMLPTVGVNDPRTQAAIQYLRSKNMPLTRANIAEAIAVGPSGWTAPAAPGGMGQRTAPPGSIEEKLMRESAQKLQQGPPAHMLRNRGMLPIR